MILVSCWLAFTLTSSSSLSVGDKTMEYSPMLLLPYTMLPYALSPLHTAVEKSLVENTYAKATWHKESNIVSGVLAYAPAPW